MSYGNIREEELKNKIASDFFPNYDCTKIIGNIDFAVALKEENESLFDTEFLLWAEAKKGKSDIYNSIVQLILTIGKARTFDKIIPPPFLGAFDAEKMAFIPYHKIVDIFYMNDFNWNVTSSNYDTKEFQLILDTIKSTIDAESLLFYYDKNSNDLKQFIKQNFILGKNGLQKIQITKNNFIHVYLKWTEKVKPSIEVNWDLVKRSGLIDGYFYLADLLSCGTDTILKELYVILEQDHYIFNKNTDLDGILNFKRIDFKNKKLDAYNEFWNIYQRPPREEFHKYMIERVDMLVPQDVRERKGSFFTPKIWVELSQKYIADVFGENWQDEYYVWDCAAGTGNLLTGLTNPRNIWASTLDKADVDIMRQLIENKASNLFKDHVFQFDFLNDDFNKLPDDLQKIINDPEKRKKLIIYINPPYAEAATANRKGNKIGVSETKIKKNSKEDVGNATNELFVQFLYRAYNEIKGVKIAEFSTLKILQSPNFDRFRKFFLAKLDKMFIVPANTFDNVKGQFPIGFKIWDTEKQEKFKNIQSDVYNNNSDFIECKKIYAYDDRQYINDWYKNYYVQSGKEIGVLNTRGNDFQNQNYIYISSDNNFNHTSSITKFNLISACVYLAVRKVIPATWLNDRDQFLFPKPEWQNDKEFQADCLCYTIFNNNIQSKFGTNHWIPFTETEIGSKNSFESDFMTEFIAGKIKIENNLTEQDKTNIKAGIKAGNTINLGKITFSDQAKDVFEAGKKLWTYYHSQSNCNVNASLYDIKEYFQGRNTNGKMKNKSEDEKYNSLISDLKAKIAVLANKITPKVYDYGFLYK